MLGKNIHTHTHASYVRDVMPGPGSAARERRWLVFIAWTTRDAPTRRSSSLAIRKTGPVLACASAASFRGRAEPRRAGAAGIWGAGLLGSAACGEWTTFRCHLALHIELHLQLRAMTAGPAPDWWAGHTRLTIWGIIPLAASSGGLWGRRPIIPDAGAWPGRTVAAWTHLILL